MSRPRSVGIQPQIAVYSIALGAACAYAAYNERYLRDQEDLDDKLRNRYLANMQEAKDKTPQMTQKIRGQDMNLDNAMNKLVWGGKAKLPETKSVASAKNDDEEEKKSSGEDDSTRGPQKRNKKRKKKKNKVDAAELEVREQEKQKLVLQSLAAGVTIGAAAVAATVLVGSKPK
ncbi:unnamed protein product [Cylindrotheca closterium]|uniref:Uncharacterized protein n=1 Tax=Cylindrotheca closterium TaxID=2856 RepID=A0AAD2JPN7_9STRA|nr:unnamed protein product [Cylindrotheca closterium]